MFAPTSKPGGMRASNQGGPRWISGRLNSRRLEAVECRAGMEEVG